MSQLPTTEDPFELLGVERGVDERELKRAYVRLIKRFRPERAPEEFKRIQAAYERARVLAAMEHALAAAPIFDDRDDDGDDDGDDRADRDDPEDAHEDGVAEEVAPPADDDAPGWDGVLAHRDDEAAELVSRIRTLLIIDDMEGLARALAPQEVGRLALRNEDAEEAVVLALCALLWVNRDLARVYYSDFAGSERTGYHHVLFDELDHLQEAWIDAHKRAPCPKALSRLIRLGRLVPRNVRDGWVEHAYDDATIEPEPCMRFLVAVGLESGALQHHMVTCFGPEVRLDRVPVDAFPDPSRGAIVTGLRRAELAVRRRMDVWLLGVGAIVATVGVVGWAVVAGDARPLAILLKIGIFGSIFWSSFRQAAYRDTARRHFFVLALEHGVGPLPMDRWIRDNPGIHSRLRRYREELTSDASLAMAAALHAGRHDPTELHQQIGDVLYEPPPYTDAESEALLTAEELGRREEERLARQRANTRRHAAIVLSIFAVLIGLLSFWFFWVLG